MGTCASSTATVAPEVVVNVQPKEESNVKENSPTKRGLQSRTSSSEGEPEPPAEEEAIVEDDTVTKAVSVAAKAGIQDVLRLMKSHESDAAYAAWCCDAIAGLCAGNGTWASSEIQHQYYVFTCIAHIVIAIPCALQRRIVRWCTSTTAPSSSSPP